MRMAGTVIVQGRRCAAREKAKPVAAGLLEAAEIDVAFENGRFAVSGTDRGGDALRSRRGVGWRCAGDRRRQRDAHPRSSPTVAMSARSRSIRRPRDVEIVRYAAVDDVGRAINPLIVDGQTHGGIVQGVGQAMWEVCVNDPGSKQPLAGSFMDYALAARR